MDYRTEKLARIYDAYEAILHRNNALDFDDLLQKAVEVLRHDPSIRERYHRQFQHVLVDEFQDTNDAQYEIVRLIVEGCLKAERSALDYGALWHNRSFTVVGDVDQSIYSWRGANFRIILNFQQDFPDARLIKLEQNYRSTGNILDLANAIIENNSERLPKSLVSVKGSGDPIVCYEAKDDRDEAFFIIDRFQELAASGAHKPGECCILYRTNSQSRVFEDILISKGIPYAVVGGTRFYERREIKDILAYLTVIFNEQDAYSIKRVLNTKRGIGKISIERIESYAQQENLPLYQALRQVDRIPELTGRAKTIIGDFIALIEKLKSRVPELSLSDFIIEVAEESGYTDELRRDDPMDNEGRIQNIEEFVSVAKQYLLDNPEGDLVGFLTQMSLLSDLDTAEPTESKLVLMTMHAAKGLEFKAVAIAGLEEGLLPHGRSLSDRSQMEEERRLMYVGITRAEEQLILTYARKRMVFGEVRYSTPSRFLKEAPPHLCTGLYLLDRESGYSDRDFYSSKSKSGSSKALSGYSSSRFEEDEPPLRRIQPKASKIGSSAIKAPLPRLLDVATRVQHAKFGAGTIEQVIGKGEKAVYSIKFDSIPGKKLLDPKFAKLEPL